MSSGSLLDSVRPCDRFVVTGPGLQATVQDSHEPVDQLAQRGVVFTAVGFELVVAGAGAGRGVQRAEGLGPEGVDEPVVVGISGENDFLFPGGAGDWAGAGVVFRAFASV